MALHTRKQFYELCGIDRPKFNVYVNRKKVVLTNDMVDDTIQQNKEFLEKYLEKAHDKVEKKPQFVDYGTQSANVTTTGKDYRHDKNINELERQLKEAELHKKRVDTQIALLKEEKLRGIVIPTDIVKVAFQQHFKSISAAFHNAADNLIVNFAKKKDLNREEIAELRGELIEVINIAIQESVAESIKTVDNIVDEYSEKKGQGERT